jgi:hypothetical protein
MPDAEYTLQKRNGYSLIVEFDRGPNREPVIVRYDLQNRVGKSIGKFQRLWEAERRLDELAPRANRT